jgi:hypothetical protein
LIQFVFDVFPFFSLRKRSLRFGDGFPRWREFSIELNKRLLISRNIILSINSIYRALWYAYRAINALVRIDDQKIRALTKAVNWANVNAIGIFAADAGFCNNVSHGVLFQETQK